MTFDLERFRREAEAVPFRERHAGILRPMADALPGAVEGAEDVVEAALRVFIVRRGAAQTRFIEKGARKQASGQWASIARGIEQILDSYEGAPPLAQADLIARLERDGSDLEQVLQALSVLHSAATEPAEPAMPGRDPEADTAGIVAAASVLTANGVSRKSAARVMEAMVSNYPDPAIRHRSRETIEQAMRNAGRRGVKNRGANRHIYLTPGR